MPKIFQEKNPKTNQDDNAQNGRAYYSSRHNNGGHESSRPVDSSKLQRIIEQDAEMVATTSHGETHLRHVPYSKSGGSNTYYAKTQQNSRGGTSWSKITIPYGRKYEKDLILKMLLKVSEVSFIPICYHIEGNNAVFFIQDSTAAEALFILNKQITMPDGFKLIISVKWSPAPNLPINEDLKGKIKQVMSRRFDPVMKVLNLSQFHLDEELCTEFYTPLSRQNVMQTVVQIIGEHITDVQVIDLSNNKIYSVDEMKPLVTKATFLKTLNLANNNLVKITSLDILKGLVLEELILNQNPLCDHFSNKHSTYIRAMRKRFPKLIKLDGVELPPIISFDIGSEDVALPSSSGSWFISDEARQIVLVFLEQYLSVYDSDNRQPLLNAYHDSAFMSLTYSYPPGQKANAPALLAPYKRKGRNLKKIESLERRFGYLLQKNKGDIVSFLSNLPKTLHDPSSLVVDVPVASSQSIVMSVTGIFRERAEKHSVIRWFQRIFIIIPKPGGGFCIVNEQFHISCATPEQIETAFKEAAVPAALPTPASSATVGETQGSSTLDDPIVQQQMVISFSDQSGMNTSYSLKCLTDNGWDFNRAAFVFTELKAANQIPPEAFIKINEPLR